jgi:hypothetical protein
VISLWSTPRTRNAWIRGSNPSGYTQRTAGIPIDLNDPPKLSRLIPSRAQLNAAGNYRAKKGNLQKNTIDFLSKMPNSKSLKCHASCGLRGLCTGFPARTMG